MKSIRERDYFIKQRILGVLLILIGIGSIFIEWDATAALLLIPLGLGAIFSK